MSLHSSFTGHSMLSQISKQSNDQPFMHVSTRRTKQTNQMRRGRTQSVEYLPREKRQEKSVVIITNKDDQTRFLFFFIFFVCV